MAGNRWCGLLLAAVLVATANAQSSAMLSVNTGSAYCTLQTGGACVTDGFGNHGNNERCTFTALQNLYLTATEFATENYFDYVMINGTRYSGTIGPSNVYLTAGSTFRWSSDFSMSCACHIVDPLAPRTR